MYAYKLNHKEFRIKKPRRGCEIIEFVCEIIGVKKIVFMKKIIDEHLKSDEMHILVLNECKCYLDKCNVLTHLLVVEPLL